MASGGDDFTAANTFGEFSRKLEDYVRRKFGSIADFFKTNEYPEIPGIEVDRARMDDDEFGLYRESIRRKIANREDAIAARESTKPMIFAIIRGQLSQEALEHLRQRADWQAANDASDPLLLWRLICHNHMIGGTDDAGELRFMARNKYNNLRQMASESIAAFKARFDNRLGAMRAVGQAIPEDAEVARDFLGKLDMERYGAMIREYRNGIHEKVETLNAAYNFASNYIVTRRTGNGNLVLVNTAQAQPTQQRQQPQAPRGGGRGQGGRQPGRGRGRGAAPGGPSRDRPCAICGSAEHWRRDCPQEDTVANAVGEARQEQQRPARRAIVGVTLVHDTMDFDDMPDEAESSEGGDMNDFLESADSDGDFVLPEVYFTSHQVTEALQTNGLGPYDIILDSGASVGVFHNKELGDGPCDVEDTVMIMGVNSNEGAIISSMVLSTDFGIVYYSPNSVGNILSYSTVKREAHGVWNMPADDHFSVQIWKDGPVYLFRPKLGIYVHNTKDARDTIRPVSVLVATVSRIKENYTAREIAQADAARDLQRKLGIPSDEVLTELINSGGLMNCSVTARDVARARHLYGPSLASLKGKTTTHKGPIVEDGAVMIPQVHRDQTLHTDIMFVEKIPFLITVSTPLHMSFATKLRSRNTETLWKALKHQISAVQSKGFKVVAVRSDGESGLGGLQPLLGQMGIDMNLCGAGEHVPVVERKIRVIKERSRGIINTLPFTIPLILISYLIYFVVSRINMVPVRTATLKTTPFEQFYGRKVNVKAQLKANFGDYVQAGANAVDNSMESRTEGGIALYDTGNVEGTWWVYQLRSKTLARRNKLAILPMPDVVIDFINAMESRDRRRRGQDHTFTMGLDGREVGVEELQEEPPPVRTYDDFIIPIPADPREVFEPQQGEEAPPGEIIMETADAVIEDTADDDDTVSDVIQLDDEDNATDTDGAAVEDQPVEDDDEGEPEQEPDPVEASPDEPIRSQVRTRFGLRENRAGPGRWAKKKREYGLHITVNQALNKIGKPAVKAIVQEIMQMESKGVWKGIRPSQLTFKQRKKIICSSMFLKEKFRADGSFEKLKARLVAGGHQQDRDAFESTNSAPTIRTSSIFIMAAIAASEGRAVATVDVPGAYLNADMPEDQEVIMRLDKYLSKVLMAVEPKYAEFKNDNGNIIVKLNKALYGCIQSAKLWYEELTSKLAAKGFIKNAEDCCVLNRVEPDGTQTSIGIHVDDIFITNMHESNIDAFLREFETVYAGLSVHKGPKVNYLGMCFDFGKEKEAFIDMNAYIAEILEHAEDGGVAKTPATNDLYKVDAMSKLLDDIRKSKFHTNVAKLYYMAKRARPDLLAALAFLITRVTCPTEQDMTKLERVIKYLRSTPTLGLRLIGEDAITMMAHVDASYGVHEDFKSHSGCTIMVGRGVVFAKSSKQKINTKSSTEAELVALSDMAGQAIWTKHFLEAQGYQIGAAAIGQDNTSTISLIKNGKSQSDRTRHIGIRFFFLKDRIDAKDIGIEYVATEDMVADILTKPLQGRLFLRLRAKLMNCAESWDVAGGNVGL